VVIDSYPPDGLFVGDNATMFLIDRLFHP